MEFQNATHWPKHLLVHYTWKHTNPVNATGGLYLVFLLGMLPLKSRLLVQLSLYAQVG